MGKLNIQCNLIDFKRFNPNLIRDAMEKLIGFQNKNDELRSRLDSLKQDAIARRHKALVGVIEKKVRAAEEMVPDASKALADFAEMKKLGATGEVCQGADEFYDAAEGS